MLDNGQPFATQATHSLRKIALPICPVSDTSRSPYSSLVGVIHQDENTMRCNSSLLCSLPWSPAKADFIHSGYANWGAMPSTA
jgi:hypothetical protein